MNGLASEAPDAFESRISGLLLATADGRDLLLDPSIPEVLRLVRENLGMDVIFVSQHVGEHSVIRHVEAAPEHRVIEEGQSPRRQDTICQRVLDGWLPTVIPDMAALRATHDIPATPFPIGAYMSAPVRLHDGAIYGILCCFSSEPQHQLGAREFRRLQMAAALTARAIDVALGHANALAA